MECVYFLDVAKNVRERSTRLTFATHETRQQAKDLLQASGYITTEVDVMFIATAADALATVQQSLGFVIQR